MDCIAGGLLASAWKWSAHHWQSMYLFLLVSVVVAVLVGEQFRIQGRVQVQAPAWVTGAGLYAVLSVYKDAWEVKFPYSLLVAPAVIVGWVLGWFSQQVSARPAVWAVAWTVGTVLGGVLALVGVAASGRGVFGTQMPPPSND
jgi:hypothetical protein